MLVLSCWACGAARAEDHADNLTKPELARRATVRVLAGYEVEFASNRRHQFVGSHGTGFFVSNGGYVITNAHVVADANLDPDEARHMVLANVITAGMQASSQGVRTVSNILEISRGIADGVRIVRRVAELVLADGQRVPYEILAAGSATPAQLQEDVAVLKVEQRPDAFLTLPTTDLTGVKRSVRGWAFPTPADGPEAAFSEPEPKLARVVAQLRGHSAREAAPLRLSSRISEGSSGGPAFDRRGRLVGMTTFGARCDPSTLALIPTSVLVQFIERAERNFARRAPRAALGPVR